jgi:hypothetical protein
MTDKVTFVTGFPSSYDENRNVLAEFEDCSLGEAYARFREARPDVERFSAVGQFNRFNPAGLMREVFPHALRFDEFKLWPIVPLQSAYAAQHGNWCSIHDWYRGGHHVFVKIHDLHASYARMINTLCFKTDTEMVYARLWLEGQRECLNT